MIVTYRLTVVARCPVNDAIDIYRVIVRSTRTIMVEDILDAVANATMLPITQEELTERLHQRLGVEVETFGDHSGVSTHVICGSNYETPRIGRDARTTALPRS